MEADLKRAIAEYGAVSASGTSIGHASALNAPKPNTGLEDIRDGANMLCHRLQSQNGDFIERLLRLAIKVQGHIDAPRSTVERASPTPQAVPNGLIDELRSIQRQTDHHLSEGGETIGHLLSILEVCL